MIRQIQTAHTLLTQPAPREEIFASTSWLLTTCQILIAVGLLGYGLVLTLMILRLYRENPISSTNRNVAWIIFAGFLIAAIVINLILQYLKKAWLQS